MHYGPIMALSALTAAIAQAGALESACKAHSGLVVVLLVLRCSYELTGVRWGCFGAVVLFTSFLSLS